MANKKSVEAMSKTPSLSMAAYRDLHRDITNSTLEPGRKLAVGELSGIYGFGVSPLRDALNQLCAEGLVTRHEQRGFFVAELDENVFLELTNARLIAEEAALRLSIAAGDVDWEEQLVLAFYRLEKAVRDDATPILAPEWPVAHREFHFGLLSACRNEWLLGFCRRLYEQSERYRARRRKLTSEGQSKDSGVLRKHKEIMKAALARDADQAGELLIHHYKESFEVVMNAEYQLIGRPWQLVPLTPTDA